MQRSIATVSLSGTLPEKLEAIAAAGFDGVEIFRERSSVLRRQPPGNQADVRRPGDRHHPVPAVSRFRRLPP
jgi:sugar phosphate isomerase/epimerase